jgi:hypothetical protein
MLGSRARGLDAFGGSGEERAFDGAEVIRQKRLQVL